MENYFHIAKLFDSIGKEFNYKVKQFVGTANHLNFTVNLKRQMI
jgi:hypothetical protein